MHAGSWKFSWASGAPDGSTAASWRENVLNLLNSAVQRGTAYPSICEKHCAMREVLQMAANIGSHKVRTGPACTTPLITQATTTPTSDDCLGNHIYIYIHMYISILIVLTDMI